jgi:hypothetical protein
MAPPSIAERLKQIKDHWEVLLFQAVNAWQQEHEEDIAALHAAATAFAEMQAALSAAMQVAPPAA